MLESIELTKENRNSRRRRYVIEEESRRRFGGWRLNAGRTEQPSERGGGLNGTEQGRSMRQTRIVKKADSREVMDEVRDLMLRRMILR